MFHEVVDEYDDFTRYLGEASLPESGLTYGHRENDDAAARSQSNPPARPNGDSVASICNSV